MIKVRDRAIKMQNIQTMGGGRIPRMPFTKEMKKDYTILIPMMAPIHFALLRSILSVQGFHVELLENCGHGVVEEGLKYVHNDTCYPALLVIGQMLDALKSGKYDLNRTALLISQTGGGCRASNYIFLLRRALKKAGYGHIPVISCNLSKMERNSGFRLSLPILRQMLAGLVYGDGLMALSNQVKAYEVHKGSSAGLVSEWLSRLAVQFESHAGFSLAEMKKNIRQMAAEFNAIPCERKPKVRVGIVGEIYVKYASLGNNNLENFLESQDCEVMVPGLLDFMLYSLNSPVEKSRIYGGGYGSALVCQSVIYYMQRMQDAMIDAISIYPSFTSPSRYSHTKSLAQGVISTGCCMGEGWLLTAEMMELVEKGYGNIVCTQPFGCLPNHICGKGMIRKIREIAPQANIVPIDYDPSATKVNQENRIKLMLAVARENLLNETGANRKRPTHSETAPDRLGKDAEGQWSRLIPQKLSFRHML